MQGNGAEMMRLACCLGTENGIKICCSIHDAFLICAPLDRLAYDVERMRGFMAEAARIVLNGFELRTDANLILYPDHYSDPRGAETWQAISSLCRIT
jgi:DNA polymerase I